MTCRIYWSNNNTKNLAYYEDCIMNLCNLVLETHLAHYTGWKGFLPVGEVHVPRWLEGLPSSRRGTWTLPSGGFPFQLARMCRYPPAVAVAGADAAFPWKSSRISGCKGASSTQDKEQKLRDNKYSRKEHQLTEVGCDNGGPVTLTVAVA
jgi:hypothetical protein